MIVVTGKFNNVCGQDICAGASYDFTAPIKMLSHSACFFAAGELTKLFSQPVNPPFLHGRYHKFSN